MDYASIFFDQQFKWILDSTFKYPTFLKFKTKTQKNITFHLKMCHPSPFRSNLQTKKERMAKHAEDYKK